MMLNKATVCIVIIVLFHAVGLTGFFVPALQPLFLRLVPFHLLLMLAVIAVSYQGNENEFWLFAAIVFVAGFLAEWIGVHKNWIFGVYQYGPTLGTKVFDIPLTIGINWFVLVYATGVLLQRSRLKSMPMRVLLGAMLLVALDLLIEPVAIRFDYWTWSGGQPPLKNFVCWFGLSAVFLYLFERFNFKPQSKVGPILLLVQFVFFGLMLLAQRI